MPLLERLQELQKEKQIVPGINESLRQGANQTREALLSEVRTLLPQLVEEAVTNIRVRNGKDGSDGSPGKTPSKEMLLNLINSVFPKPKEKKAEIEDVKGLRNLLDNLSQRISRAGGKKGGGGSTVVTDDLSSSLDGSTRTFTTSKTIGTPLIVSSTQFPTVLRPTVDYTTSGTTLTLTSEVDAPASGQTLIIVYVEG